MTYDVKVPLLGFENIKKMSFEKIDDIFIRLKDEGDSGITFTLIDPFMLRDYSFEIPKEYQKALEIDEGSELLIYNIMIIQTPIEDSTVNFLAPVIFNKTKKYMGQIILDNAKYPDFYIIDKISNYISQ